MPKRESEEEDVSRLKRRKGDSSQVVAPAASGSGSSGPGGSTIDVKEAGMKLWQTIKDATDTDGRALSAVFLIKPSKRLYPSYYDIIKRPIAFDDIKKRILLREYRTLEAVRDDFELCFNNALQFNQPESLIAEDANTLLKLTAKTYRKLTSADTKTTDKDKDKPPSLHRLLKTRLQKLTEITTEDGRQRAADFMVLPNKKVWPVYYQVIKHPECFENIFKRVKRKEYPSAAEFAADVETIFSNAVEFNQDDAPIVEDAAVLKEAFKKLMSDLPPPYALPQYSKSSGTKIKLKVPGASAATPVKESPRSLTLKVPAAAPKASTSKATIKSPEPVSKPAPPPPKVSPPSKTTTKTQSATAAKSKPAAPETPTQAPKPVARTIAAPTPKVAAPQPVTFQQVLAQPQPTAVALSVAQQNAYTNSYYPKATYNAAISTAKTVSPPVLAAAPTPIMNPQPYSASASPAPLSPAHTLKNITLKFEPRGRIFYLDQSLGVKSWHIRLGKDETSVHVSNITYMAEDDDDNHSGEEEEEEEDADMDVDSPAKNGKKKGKKSRGKPVRTKAKAKVVTRSVKVAEKKPVLNEIQVKLDGSLVKEEAENTGNWSVPVPAGSHTMEIGEKGGMTWKVYIGRLQ